MKVLFLHGWQSVPGGVKPTYLAQHGHEVINPKLPDEDFAEAVKTAQDEFDKHESATIVGSSRGSAVAMNAKIGGARFALLCPPIPRSKKKRPRRRRKPTRGSSWTHFLREPEIDFI